MKAPLLDAATMRRLGKAIKQSLPDGLGFTILVFPFFDTGIMNYISNAQRGDMIKALREMADKLESGGEFKTPESN